MINIYLGNTLTGCSQKILKDIQRKKAKDNHILIVPDRFTLSTELKVLELVQSTLNIEVLTFSRLAIQVTENETKTCLSSEGAVMVLTNVLNKCRDKLICYSKSINSLGFASQMYATLTAIRNNGITVEELECAADKLKGHARDKIKDIVTIYANYIDELQQNYIDSTTRLEMLKNKIKDSQFIAKSHFYFADFYTFTSIQYDIIREIMKNALSVSVAAIADMGGANRRIFPSEMRKRITALAQESGSIINEIDAFEALSLPKQIIESNIFGYGTDKYPNLDYAYLYKAASMEEEIEFICRRISDSVRKEGSRFKEIAVVCGDILSYLPFIKKNFEKYEIPYAIDTKSALSDEPLIKALLIYLKININNYSRGDVLEYAKNYFSKIGQKSYDFENYCLRYAIDYSRFLSPFKLGEEEERTAAEKVRANLLSQLRALPSVATIKEFIQLLYEFMSINGFDQTLNTFAKIQSATDITAAMATVQVPHKLKTLLDELDQLMGKEVSSLQKFYELLKSGFDSVKIATLPQSADCVYIGEAEDSRYEQKKILFIIGATSDTIPSSKSQGIFGEREYIELQSADVVIKPSSRETSLYSRFYVQQLLLLPCEKLFVGYSEYNSKGNFQSASTVIEQLSDIFDIPIHELENLAEDGVYTMSSAYSMVLAGIRKLRRGLNDAEKIAHIDALYHSLTPELKLNIESILMPDTEKSIEGKEIFFANKHTSVSQLETYFGCPYKHFIRYGLRAKEKISDRIQPNETGIILHDVLEEYFRTTKCFGITEDEIAQKTNAIVDKVYEDPRFASRIGGAASFQLERLRREALQITTDLTHLCRQSEFVPTEFEVKFGGQEEGNYEGIKLIENNIELIGKIDRIDTFKNYVAVIDYKTNSVNAELQDVFYGKKIQLFIYLGALRQAGKIPAAAFYLELKADYKKKEEVYSRYCYKGHLLNDSRIIEAFDKQIRKNNMSLILPVTSENGAYIAKRNILLKPTEMDNVINYAVKLAETAVKEIMEGNILPNPLVDECIYCPAKSFCSFDAEQRAMRSVNVSSFEVENEV